MVEAFKVDGKDMKACPGWSGNKFRCGKGSPRLIPADDEVCRSCRTSMHKAGERTRDEARDRIRAEIRARIELNNLAWHAREAGAEVDPLQALGNAVEASEDLREWHKRAQGKDEKGVYLTSWDGDVINTSDRFDLLVALAGHDPFLPPFRDPNDRHYRSVKPHSDYAVAAQRIDGATFVARRDADTWDWPKGADD